MPSALIQLQLCNPMHHYHIPPLVLLIQHLTLWVCYEVHHLSKAFEVPPPEVYAAWEASRVR